MIIFIELFETFHDILPTYLIYNHPSFFLLLIIMLIIYNKKLLIRK
jgi:hypothetical protein